MGNETNQRKDEKLFILIISCLREPNFYRKLHLAYLLTFNIDDELGKKYDLEKFQKNIHDLLVDTNFLRAVHHRESIIMEDGHIYFGQEHIGCDYNYEPELEQAITGIDVNITEFLAAIVKELDIPKGFSFDSVATP